MSNTARIILVLSVLFLSACSSSYRSVTQVEDRGILQLNGNFWGTSLELDSEAAVIINRDTFSSYYKDGKELIEFPVAPGSHKVHLKRDGKTIVLRTIYVGNGNIFEVVVP
ncbi:hypothetical protein [Pseudoalteromonas sp. bablab_jr011]|uniref:hypothetical protein n=1 Tax=Pseudoalteromonas sp. bablab_jr011 TaxID=2755062 RepID=UPI0018F3EA70|nr:hypothetical protein [Pseudoalteromonas sp. bablab_jr011]